MESEESINKYAMGGMSEIESQDFKNRLSSDKELKTEYETYLRQVESVDDFTKEIFTDWLKVLDKSK